MSETSAAIAVLADVFLRFGRAEVTSVAGAFDRDSLWRSAADPVTLDRLFETKTESWPRVFFVSEWNMEAVANESSQFRKTVQGRPVAKRIKRG
jgi:hypothetical protein